LKKTYNKNKNMKKILGEIKLQIFPGKANPAPPIGPALGQKGVNIGDFCKQFNDKTKDKDPDMKLPVLVKVYADRTFSFTIKSPPVSSLLKKHAGIKKGSSTPGKEFSGTITESDVLSIAKIKFLDMGLDSEETAKKVIKGTALSMGIKIVN